ncbi:hypothetical protein [Aminobacter sp. LjRoot7]|uniref:hypothetical protein n=1 Tax=Aminobacter sp. LjRoot7 TaxID=3342335 RepID=UPI003ED0B2EA
MTDCYVKFVGDEEGNSPGWTPVFSFLEVPRIGESVALVPSRKRDADDVYRAGRYRVQDVIHAAATDYSAANISIHVVLEQAAHEAVQEPAA